MGHKTLLRRVLFPRTVALIVAALAVGVLIPILNLRTPQPAKAATASTLNFQARLLSTSGAVVPDGFYNVQFKLYSAVTGGAALWTDTRYDQNGGTAGQDYRLRVVNGYLTVNLADTTVGGTAFPAINWDQDLYITMNIGGTAQTASPTWDGEMVDGSGNRMKLTAVPYAFRAGQLAKLTGGNTSTLDFATQTGANSILLPDAGGTLAIATGGSFTTNGVLFGNGTSSIQATAAGSTGQCLVATTGSAPSWGSCTGGASITLQGAYDAPSGNTITTTDNRNIAFSLADTATDSDFTVNLQGTGNTFELQDGGSAFFTASDGRNISYTGGNTGQLSVSSLLSGGARSTALVAISQANDGTNNSSAPLVSIDNQDTGSSGGVLQVVDAGTGPAVLINKTGSSGNVLDVQKNGTSVFTVANNGNTTLGNTATQNNVIGLNVVQTFTSADNCVFGCYGTSSNITINAPANALAATAMSGRVSTAAAAFTLSSAHVFRAFNPTVGAGSTITENYGLMIDAQTSGATDFGAAIGAADTQTLWLSNNADNTTASAGIAFGLSRDTNLYRSAADTLRTDDSLSVGGSATVAGTMTLGASAGSGALLNNGSTVNTTLALGNFATGGSIGSATSTVDIYTSISVAQTTASQTLTLPTPTASTAYGRMLYISNVGTAAFTVGGITINASATATLMWTNTNGGASWTFAGVDGASILNQSAVIQTANFRISGTGEATLFTGTRFDHYTSGSTLAIGTITAGNIAIGRSGFTTATAGALTVNQLLTGNAGATIAGGAVSINTTGTANTDIGNATGTFQLNSNTLDITTGGALSGVTGIATSGGYTQTGTTANTFTGASTFSATGTALSVTDSASVGGTLTLGASAGSGALLNNGSTVNTTLALGNFASGGSIGSAASTVDIYTSISVAQTTASQTLSVPTPTANTTYGRVLYISNIGTAAFTMSGTTVSPGAMLVLVWSNSNGGAAWVIASNGSTANAFIQGGNDFNATAVLGTTDNDGLQIITNNVGRAYFGTSNNLYFGNAGTSGTAASPNSFTLQGTGSATAGTAGGSLSMIAGAGATTGAGSVGGVLTLQGGSGGSTDIAGGNLVLAGGRGTGTGVGGSILLQIATPAGSTGSSNNALTTVGTISGTNGSVLLQPTADTTTAFNVKTSLGNNVLTVDSSNGRLGVGLGSNNVPSAALHVRGSLRIGTLIAGDPIMDDFTTPVGSNVETAINIPLYDPGNNGQIVAMGLASGANATARGISLFDARAGAHQPTLAVFSPDENTMMGFTWDGSNTVAKLRTGDRNNANTAGLTLQSGDASAGTNSSGAIVIQSGSSATTNSGSVTIDSGAAASGTPGSISIGTTNSRSISIGNGTGATTVSVLCGTGACGFGNNATAHTTTVGSVTAAAATTLQAGTGGLNITTTGTGALNIGNNAVAQTVNIGNSTGATAVSVLCGTGACSFGNNATAHTTTVGSVTAAAATTLQAGTGGLNITTTGTGALAIGNNAVAQTLSIGNTTGATAMNLRVGTGNFTLDGVAGSTYDIGTSAVGGTVAVGGTAQTGAMTLGRSTATNTINIGAAAGNTATQTINIGTSATGGSTTNVVVGSTIAGTVTLQGNVAVPSLSSTAGNTVVCRNGSNLLAVCGTGSGSPFVQGGNDFNATAVLGTTDTDGLQVITNNVGRAYFDTSNNLYFGNAGTTGTAATPNNFTLQGTGSATAGTAGGNLSVIAGAGATTGAGSVGGVLSLQGGNGGGSNIAGGNLVLSAGQGTGTGVGGNILLQVALPTTSGSSNNSLTTVGTISGTDGSLTYNRTASFGSAAASSSLVALGSNHTFGTGINCLLGCYGIVGSSTINASSTNPNTGTAIAIKGGASVAANGSPYTVGGAAALYASNASIGANGTLTNNYGLWIEAMTAGTNDYGIAAGTSDTQTLWLGNDSDSITANAGIAFGQSRDIKLFRGATNSLAVQGTSDGSAIFQVQNAAGASQLSVETSNTSGSLNLAQNSGAESGTTSPTNWALFGTSTLSRTVTTGTFAGGTAAAQAAATAGTSGLTNNLGAALTVGQKYIISFSAKISSGTWTNDIDVRYNRTGTTTDGGNNVCSTSNSGGSSFNTRTISNSTWTKVTCFITVTGSAGDATANLAIFQTASATRTFYIDNLSIVAQNATGTQNSGTLRVGGATSQGLTLFTLDTYAGNPFTGTNAALAGSMYFDTTTNKIQCYDGTQWGACGAAPNSIVTITPEYPGAVLHGSGTGTDVGILTSDFCANSGALTVGTLCGSNDARNFYKWTSPQNTMQEYDIYVTYKLPSTFKNFLDDSTITLTARSDGITTSDGTVTYEMYKSTGSAITACGTETTVTSTQATWQTVSINGNENSTCAFAANNNVIFKIRVKARNNANVYVENLNFTFTNQ